MDEPKQTQTNPNQVALIALASVSMLWLAGPPLGIWPLAFFAIMPWLYLATSPTPLTRNCYWFIWIASTAYWLIALQGLRHAHPVMYACWIALSAYLAVYHVAFVGVTRRAISRGVPLLVAAPIVWVATELVRNYFLTGISAAMLGHLVVDVPVMIQIADLFGSYGVGVVLVCSNVATFVTWQRWRGLASSRSALVASSFASALLIASIAYGMFRTSEPIGESLGTFALLQRDEEVNYVQSPERQEEIFQNYANQAVKAVRESEEPIAMIVWPESMFSGATPWMTAAPDATIPAEASMTAEEFQAGVADHQRYFTQRCRYIQQLMVGANSKVPPPELLAGCGVIDYADTPQMFSGVIHVDTNGDIVDWYGKTHLVLVGENIPLVCDLPWIGQMVPHLNKGEGGKRMEIAGIGVSPNICIETAVERVTVNQMRSLASTGEMPNMIATVTNDGWFDDSSVLEHHLRCAQLVAVGIRRPIVSAANNGPTAHIDSNGKVVARLANGTNETLITKPRKDDRSSVYVRIGDLPAWCCVLIVAFFVFRKQGSDVPLADAKKTSS
ncbi:apolipoprotein N-acyltransferase [Rubripirellula reticaptiva]|uniref:Apolipoprotein N-acyltransferase n=1 Tax=Rubripirellula reticaptiva TaxID=2528013 RepID=A0A5C6EGP7_9BACT|nr:apolipoprotein N-acyltransferase [Rubripirellula reticaptiva]TWU46419.1 Apolipoprotein N-acyltransferase [Rubripirellula reticaptiva]